MVGVVRPPPVVVCLVPRPAHEIGGPTSATCCFPAARRLPLRVRGAAALKCLRVLSRAGHDEELSKVHRTRRPCRTVLRVGGGVKHSSGRVMHPLLGFGRSAHPCAAGQIPLQSPRRAISRRTRRESIHLSFGPVQRKSLDASDLRISPRTAGQTLGQTLGQLGRSPFEPAAD